MKAFLINPFDKEITEVDYSGKFDQAYKLMDCSYVEFQYNIPKHVLILDEEARFKKIKAYFKVRGFGTEFVNCALVVGGKSGTSDATITLESLKELIQFPLG